MMTPSKSDCGYVNASGARSSKQFFFAAINIAHEMGIQSNPSEFHGLR